MTGRQSRSAVARRRNIVTFVIRLVCLVATLTAVAYLVDLKHLSGLMRDISPWVILLALMTAVFRTWLTSLRWRLLNPDTSGQLNAWDYFRYVMVSKTLNLFMPGALGGDLARSVIVVRAVKTRRSANVFAIIVDRVVGLASILALGTVACLAAPVFPERWRYVTILAAAIACFVLAVIVAVSELSSRVAKALLSRLGRVGSKGVVLLESWRGAVLHYKSDPWKVLLAAGLCVLIHASWFAVVFLLARGIGMDVAFLTICTVTALVWVITAVPLTFSGLGVRELSFVYLLGLQGVEAGEATALSLYQFGIIMLLGVLGVPFLLMGRFQGRGSPKREARTVPNGAVAWSLQGGSAGSNPLVEPGASDAGARGGSPKTLIVLGLTYNQVPLIEKAREMGYRTVAIGTGGGAPVACGVADAWFPINASDKEAVLALAKKEHAAGLVTCGTSTAMCTIAYVTEKLGLSSKVISYKTSLEAVFKDRFRKVVGDLMPHGLSATDAQEAFERSRGFAYPLILKPGDGGGGKGITVVRDDGRDSFAHAFDYAGKFSHSKVVVAEEFIQGPVLGAESFVLDGLVHLLVIADKMISPPPRCITLGIAFPSKLPDDVQRRIREVNAAAITRLGIRWGPTHIDMAVNAAGEPRIIDIGPRLAGGPLMATLVPEAYGYSFYEAAIRLATGQAPLPMPQQTNGKYYASALLVSDRPGVLRSISYSQEDVARYAIQSIQQLVSDGSTLGAAENDGARVMFFTTHGRSYQQGLSNLEGFASAVRLDVG